MFRKVSSRRADFNKILTGSRFQRFVSSLRTQRHFVWHNRIQFFEMTNEKMRLVGHEAPRLKDWLIVLSTVSVLIAFSWVMHQLNKPEHKQKTTNERVQTKTDRTIKTDTSAVRIVQHHDSGLPAH